MKVLNVIWSWSQYFYNFNLLLNWDCSLLTLFIDQFHIKFNIKKFRNSVRFLPDSGPISVRLRPSDKIGAGAVKQKLIFAKRRFAEGSAKVNIQPRYATFSHVENSGVWNYPYCIYLVLNMSYYIFYQIYK